MMPDVSAAAVRRLLEGTTPPPWHGLRRGGCCEHECVVSEEGFGGHDGRWDRVADRRLAAAAPDIAAAYVAAAEALQRVAALLSSAPTPVYDDITGNFLGFGGAAAHRTVGSHRAWSDCGEWCYPDLPCEACDSRVYPSDLRTALGGSDGQD